MFFLKILFTYTGTGIEPIRAQAFFADFLPFHFALATTA
jgi:hypothetical protein